MEWQPIETAPKDGTSILVCNGGQAWICKWYNLAKYGKEYKWMVIPMWDAGIYIESPTHWMPLPEPPTSSKK